MNKLLKNGVILIFNLVLCLPSHSVKFQAWPGQNWERTINNVDDLKRSITIEHLLTMTSGLYPIKKDSEKRGTFGLFSENDWVQAVLDRPVTSSPGELFKYKNGGSYLLSAIIQKAVGHQTKTFAEQYLFEPIGMVVVFTGRLSSSYSFIPKQLVDKYMLKASQSDLPLAPHLKAYNQLNKLIGRHDLLGKSKK